LSPTVFRDLVHFFRKWAKDMGTVSPPAPKRRHERDRSEWWAALEERDDTVVVRPTRYHDGEHVGEHSHSRSQLLYAMTGVVTVTTSFGRWMLPPEHALWIPAATIHSVDIAGEVEMRSVYVKPDALAGLPAHLHVAALTPLMRSLILAASDLPPGAPLDPRGEFLMGSMLHEIPRLAERPLGLAFPAEKKLAELCRAFLAAPSPHSPIDAWATALGMSRRTFTRHFRRQTGLSLSTWRRQACLMAALPRLSAGEPVTRVALDLGYDSVPAFTTMFRRMLGAAPRTYLRSARM
jgi:AraC-like DNA-binding protein/quercetin dioxygenase-like cupin family protein